MYYANELVFGLFFGAMFILNLTSLVIKSYRKHKKDSQREADEAYRRSRNVAVYEERHYENIVRRLENSSSSKQKYRDALLKELQRLEKEDTK